MSTIAAQVANLLLKIRAIKLQPNNPFTWASGLKSPIYCDNRILLSYPKSRDFIKNAMKEKCHAFREFDIVAGVATAGIAHGVLLADLLDKPFVYVRPRPKSHGRQNRIEGHLEKNTRALVVEDLISTGKSSWAACEALIENEVEIVGVLAIFTYGFEQSINLFTEKAIPMDTLSNYRVLINEARELDYISEEEMQILKEWNNNPEKWAEKFKVQS